MGRRPRGGQTAPLPASQQITGQNKSAATREEGVTALWAMVREEVDPCVPVGRRGPGIRARLPREEEGATAR